MLSWTGNEHDIYIKICACVIMANWYPWYACNGIDQLRWPIFCLHWATNIVQQSIQPSATTNMVKTSHICQSDNYVDGEPKEEEWRIAYHVKQYVVYHCLVTEMNRHLIQRLSVRLRTPFHTYKDMAQHSVNAIAIHHNWQLDRAVITICNFIAVSRAYIAWIA